MSWSCHSSLLHLTSLGLHSYLLKHNQSVSLDAIMGTDVLAACHPKRHLWHIFCSLTENFHAVFVKFLIPERVFIKSCVQDPDRMSGSDAASDVGSERLVRYRWVQKWARHNYLHGEIFRTEEIIGVLWQHCCVHYSGWCWLGWAIWLLNSPPSPSCTHLICPALPWHCHALPTSPDGEGSS